MSEHVVDLQASLHEYFGFNQFKDEQEAIIQTVIDGRDCLVIMPTGGRNSHHYFPTDRPDEKSGRCYPWI